MYKEALEKYGSERKAATALDLSRTQFNNKLKAELGLCRVSSCKLKPKPGRTRCESHMKKAGGKPETKKKYNKKYYHQNKESISEYNKNYQKNNLDKFRESAKKWRQSSKGKIYSQVKRARKINLEDRGLIPEELSRVLTQMPVCQNCSSKENLTLDHHIPLTRGGTLSLGNVVILCNPCNSSKKNSLPIDFYDSKKLNKINKLLKTQVNFHQDVPVAHQKIKKDLYITGNSEVFNIDEINLQNESYSSEHKEFIEKYEWLGTVGRIPKWVFAARGPNKELIAVVMLNEPIQYTKNLGKLEALIQRGAVSELAPKNLNSKIVMFSCKWMVQNTDKRYFSAYADPRAGEIGTIYQACNFDYLGKAFGSTKNFILTSGKRVSARYFTNTSAMKRYCKELGIEWQKGWETPSGFLDRSKLPSDIRTALSSIAEMKRKECKTELVPPKMKYILVLGTDSRETKTLRKTKMWGFKPYPKRCYTK